MINLLRCRFSTGSSSIKSSILSETLSKILVTVKDKVTHYNTTTETCEPTTQEVTNPGNRSVATPTERNTYLGRDQLVVEVMQHPVYMQ